MDDKIKIAKLLVILGFFMNLACYTIELSYFYNGRDTSIIFEEVENTDKNNKERSDKEDTKKIVQYHFNNIDALYYYGSILCYPELNLFSCLVFLEDHTPPPEYI